MFWKRAGPLKHLGGASGQRNLAVAAERLGAVEARLGPGPPPLQRGVHGHSRNALQDHQILVGLEARAERPFDLQVVADVDVLVEHEDVLEPRDAAEQRGDGEPRLAEAALPDRDAQRVRAARRVPRIDRDRIAPRGLAGFASPRLRCGSR